jgi:hypothetical protein
MNGDDEVKKNLHFLSCFPSLDRFADGVSGAEEGT